MGRCPHGQANCPPESNYLLCRCTFTGLIVYISSVGLLRGSRMCRSDARWCWPGAAGGPGNLATSPGSLNTVDRWARRALVTPGPQRRRSASYTAGTEKGIREGEGPEEREGPSGQLCVPVGRDCHRSRATPPPQPRTEGRTGGARPRCPCGGGDCVVNCVVGAWAQGDTNDNGHYR